MSVSIEKSLTERQRQLLQMAAEGLTSKAMALRLGIAPGTVKNHFATLLGTLGVGNRCEAVALGYRLGLLKLDRERE